MTMSAELEELTQRMKTAVGTDSGLGKTLKFDLKGDGFVFIDGGTVTNEDRPADLTLKISMKDLIKLGEGKLDPMTAVMTGALGLSDMGVAMGLQGKMQALFSKLR
jgi:putative sterol carrier protein